MRDIIIIGSGFSSLSAACHMAKAGYKVTILEKNATIGGRARKFEKDGFKFDMGPTWYWMPDVFEKFFKDFDKKPSDYYQLERLSPAYQVYFGKDDSITIPGTLNEIYDVFEKEEKGSAKHLKSFLDSAKFNYEVAINDLVYKPGESITELINFTTKLQQILEFPVLF